MSGSDQFFGELVSDHFWPTLLSLLVIAALSQIAVASQLRGITYKKFAFKFFPLRFLTPLGVLFYYIYVASCLGVIVVTISTFGGG